MFVFLEDFLRSLIYKVCKFLRLVLGNFLRLVGGCYELESLVDHLLLQVCKPLIEVCVFGNRLTLVCKLRNVETLCGLVKNNGLQFSDLHLEITESAYTEDAQQIIATVNTLRDAGFVIEMDDFGSGYSSLNMISNLPIDVLKLDMMFIRSVFRENGNLRILKLIVDIADILSVPMIAEGVETEEQLKALREMGCDMVQGYYFSPPKPAADFEKHIEKWLEAVKER